MKYIGMSAGMWLLFHRSFRQNMVTVLGFSKEEAARTERETLPKYRAIIAGLPTFEKDDRFKMNIVNCAMLAAFYLNMTRKPTVAQMTEYYVKTMMIGLTRAFCRMAGRQKFTEKDMRGMEATAKLRAADRNPYSWNMELLPYPDGSGLTARRRCWIAMSGYTNTIMNIRGRYNEAERQKN